MKNRLIWLLAIALMFSGCSTTSEIKAGQSILAVQTIVHNTMGAYEEALSLGYIDLRDRLEVRRLYRLYELHEQKAVLALSLSADLRTTPSPEELSNIAYELTILITSLIN